MDVKKYEYQKIPIHHISEEHYHGTIKIQKLQKLGAEGWQLVTVSSGECIFVRERTEEHPLADVRPAVAWFAAQMEEQLKKNDFKEGWYNCDPNFLKYKLESKAGSFEDNVLHHGLAIGSHPVAAITEAAHIGNYAMMVAARVYHDATGEKL